MPFLSGSFQDLFVCFWSISFRSIIMRCLVMNFFGIRLFGVHPASWICGGSVAHWALLKPGVGERRVLTWPNRHCLLQSLCCWMGQERAQLAFAPSWHYLGEGIKVLPASTRWGMEDKLPALYSCYPKTYYSGSEIRPLSGYSRERLDDHILVFPLDITWQ